MHKPRVTLAPATSGLQTMVSARGRPGLPNVGSQRLGTAHGSEVELLPVPAGARSRRQRGSRRNLTQPGRKADRASGGRADPEESGATGRAEQAAAPAPAAARSARHGRRQADRGRQTQPGGPDRHLVRVCLYAGGLGERPAGPRGWWLALFTTGFNPPLFECL